ncbi:hypothetical protein PYW07_016322 [Mythimna separata]|uniref:Scavenger receptor class B member 1 n=1 Tax=Mythimna separata TaxID=271217 RepID=A0AAD7YJG1_MYTSE|nr:hypothetical protein PYW07_016322 [Mythimna separata]
MKEALKMGYIPKGSSERNKQTKIRFLVSLVIGVGCLIAAMLTVIINPIHIISVYCARVDYGTYVHDGISKEIDSIHLSVYLFNITNAERFVSGEDEKLKVEEVGPFTYQENRTNEELVIDKEAGVMRYSPRYKSTFLPEESVGRPEDMMLTLPNIAMLSMGSLLSNYNYFTQLGFNMLALRLDSNATVQISAHDYLWGYNEPLISVGNIFLPGWINFDTMGLLDRLYNREKSPRVEVSANNEDKFMIRTINGLGGLPSWGYPEKSSSCNSFNSTFEGLLYPSKLTPDRPLKIYRNVLCRFMELEYVGPKTMDFGVEGLSYKFTNRSFSKIPENDCMCNHGVCHDGVSDLSPCYYGLPVVLSNAHFYDTNPLIYERVEGMNPNEEQHGSNITIEPVIGMVMETKFSVQVNVLVRDVSFNSKMSRFSDMVVPVGYFKVIQPKMPDDQIANLRLIHVITPPILLTAQVALVLAGLFFLAYSAKLLYCHWICARRKDTVFDSNKNINEISVKESLSIQPLMQRRISIW